MAVLLCWTNNESLFRKRLKDKDSHFNFQCLIIADLVKCPCIVAYLRVNVVQHELLHFRSYPSNRFQFETILQRRHIKL